MKLALYCDASSLSSIYIKDLLRKSFNGYGHVLDIFINPRSSTMVFSVSLWKNSCFRDINILFGIPRSSEYDGLLLTNQLNKDGSYRNNVMLDFQRGNKKVVAIKDTCCIDFWELNNSVEYGVPGLQHILCKEFRWVDSNTKIFDIPVLSNFSYIKPNCLREDDFYKKYNLKKELKIVGFYPDGMHGAETLPASNWQHKNLMKIDAALNKIGYQIVCKLHPFEYYGRKTRLSGGIRSNLFYFPDTPTIYEEDAYELIKFSTMSMSSISAVGYEHYLYDLPHLAITCDVGVKVRINGFSDNLDKYNIQNWQDLIFGDTVDYNVFSSNIREHFLSFLSKNHLKEFKHRYNNPIYGNSYQAPISKITETILDKFI